VTSASLCDGVASADCRVLSPERPLGRRLTLWCLRACSRKSLLALVMPGIARGDLVGFVGFPSSSLLELRCSKSNSSGPLLVRKTKALAFLLCRLNRPRIDETNPSPARSLEVKVHQNSLFDLEGIVIEQAKDLSHLFVVCSICKEEKPKPWFYVQGGVLKSWI